MDVQVKVSYAVMYTIDGLVKEDLELLLTSLRAASGDFEIDDLNRANVLISVINSNLKI